MDLLKNADKSKSVYVLFGESFLVKMCEKKLLNMYAGQGGADIFREHTPVGEIIDCSDTVSFFSEQRVIVVRNSGLFSSGKKEDSKIIEDYIKSSVCKNILIFSEKEADKRLSVSKTAAKYANFLEFSAPKESELISWIKSVLKKEKIDIGSAEAAIIVRYSGGNMEKIYTETEKLASYCSKRVTAADIDAVCVKAVEAKIFALTAAIGNRSIKNAFDEFYSLIFARESAIMILGMIARQFRMILICSSLERSGAQFAEIVSRTGLKEFIVRECIRQSANFSEQELISAINDCLETDAAIKTGKLKDILAVELLIVKYGKNSF
ncbi:MAG: DNA polymerase III subunit delta [Clostridiales bacterium]|jgi:DNA polymerase-3 subunit delta|nr:DNA polymerase III subunit delta [Clostridiales bacterium]